MGRILYDGKRLIPAPLVSISKEYLKVGQEKIGHTFRITLANSMICYKGSPASVVGPIGTDSSGDWSGRWYIGSNYPSDETHSTVEAKANSILRKQEALRELFSQDGLLLEIQSGPNQPVKCRPRIVSISFADGVWVDTIPYTIELECDELLGLNVVEETYTNKVSDASENWEIQYDEENQTYNMSHQITAVGKLYYDAAAPSKRPWEHARDFVIARIGYDNSFAQSSGVLNLSLNNYNHVRTQTVDELVGSYGYTESWILSSTNYIEDYTVETNVDSQDGKTTLSIQGNIRGLESRDSSYSLTQSKWSSASGAFYGTVLPALYTRATLYRANIGQGTLNSTPLANSVGINPKQGTITYNYSYDTRPSNCISNARSEVITIVDNNPGKVIATIPVLGRIHGPVLQDIGTYTPRTRQLTIELIMGVSGVSCNPLLNKPSDSDIATIISNVTPVGSQVYKTSDQTTWDFKTGRFSKQIEWMWEQ